MTLTAVAGTQLDSALRWCKALSRQVFPSPHASGKLSSKEFWEACEERCSGVRWRCPGTPLFSCGLPRTWLLLCERGGLVTELFGLQTEEQWRGSDWAAFLPEAAFPPGHENGSLQNMEPRQIRAIFRRYGILDVQQYKRPFFLPLTPKSSPDNKKRSCSEATVPDEDCATLERRHVHWVLTTSWELCLISRFSSFPRYNSPAK